MTTWFLDFIATKSNVPYPPPPLGGGGRIGDTEGDESLPKTRFFFFLFGEFRLEYSYVPVCQSYILVCTRMYWYVSRMLLVCYSYVPVCTGMFSYVTRMLFTRMYSFALVRLLVCTRMYSMSLVCHPCGVLVTAFAS